MATLILKLLENIFYNVDLGLEKKNGV